MIEAIRAGAESKKRRHVSLIVYKTSPDVKIIAGAEVTVNMATQQQKWWQQKSEQQLKQKEKQYQKQEQRCVDHLEYNFTCRSA